MTLLDIGCDTGAIARDGAEAVAPNGLSVGVDVNQHLIEEARGTYGHVPWLSFEVCDVYYPIDSASRS